MWIEMVCMILKYSILQKYIHCSCFVVFRQCPILPISFRVISLALGPSYDCPSASETNPNDMVKSFIWITRELMIYSLNKTKHNETMFMLYGIYCMCMSPMCPMHIYVSHSCIAKSCVCVTGQIYSCIFVLEDCIALCILVCPRKMFPVNICT